MSTAPVGLLPVIVRREVAGDADAVAAVHTAAFGGSDPADVVEARLARELREDGAALPALSLVATVDGRVVGHVVVSRAVIGASPSLGLGPLGVLPAHQRQGTGSALVLAAADALDEPSVVLFGDPAYYRRFGVVPAAPLGIAPPDPTWVAHLQVRRLAAWDPAVRGPFRYAGAFDRHWWPRHPSSGPEEGPRSSITCVCVEHALRDV